MGERLSGNGIRLMMSRTWLFSPSTRPLLIPKQMAASRPSPNFRMVCATLTNGARRERLAREHQRPISSAVWPVEVAAKISRNASFRV